jgi:hypothetical protein
MSVSPMPVCDMFVINTGHTIAIHTKNSFRSAEDPISVPWFCDFFFKINETRSRGAITSYYNYFSTRFCVPSFAEVFLEYKYVA